MAGKYAVLLTAGCKAGVIRSKVSPCEVTADRGCDQLFDTFVNPLIVVCHIAVGYQLLGH